MSATAQKISIDSIKRIIHLTENDSIKGHQYAILAERYYRRDSSLSKLYIDSSRMIINYADLPIAKGMYMYIEGKWLKTKNENEKAIEKLVHAKDHFKGINNKGMIRATEYELGAVYLASADYEQANRSFLEYRKLSEIAKDSNNLANAISALGVVQRRMGNTAKAADFYREALPIFKIMKNNNGISTCLLNIAIVEKTNKNYGVAIKLYSEAEQIARLRKPIDENLIGYIYGNISSMYDDQKKYLKAYDYAIKAFDIRKNISGKTEIINSNIGLASISLKLGRTDESIKYLNIAQENVGSDLYQQDQINRLFAKAWYKKNDYKKAYDFLNNNKSIQDSIYSLDKANQVEKLNSEFDLERKENEISQLELASEIDQVKISNQKNGLLGLGLSMTLLGLLFYRLNGQKKKIDIQNEEKDILLKEIHHRVKNNLQVISSLLGMQSRSIKDVKAKEAILEGRTRVHSMSLIHQNLYQKDNLTGIEMKAYLTKLSKNLFDTYNLDANSIDLRTEIDPIKLDVDTVIPIGLIVNELITNALKYAFPNNKRGIITVSLSEVDEKLLLLVSDNGIGISDIELMEKQDSFGHSLIRAFKKKLEADITIKNEGGTSVQLEIKNYKNVA